jgi:hypothetical protein
MPEQKTFRLNPELKIDDKKHLVLLQHLQDRLKFGNQPRNNLVNLYTEIDKELAGFIVLDEDDEQRKADRKLGKGALPTESIIQLAITQLDECVTYLMSVFAGDDMYAAIAPEDQLAQAQALALVLEKHGTWFKHYKVYARMMLDMLRYNIGGCTVEWQQILGNKIGNTEQKTPEIKTRQALFAGNKLTPIDTYNFIYDISVEPSELAQFGEFFATIELKTKFRIRKMMFNNEMYATEEMLTSQQSVARWYKTRPVLRNDIVADGGTNWFNFLTATHGAPGAEVGANLELVTMSIWIVPKDLGLGASTEMEIWQFKLLNDTTIVFGAPLKNAHSLLPAALARIIDDGYDAETKGYAEMLLPYQRFASFQLNTHQAATRKKLYGLTLYDEEMIPLMASADALGGRVPVKRNSQDKPLSAAVHVINDTPETSRTLDDIDKMDDLMQKILPTDILKQVTSLERATTYQSAATVQGSNRRNLKMAHLINSQCLEPMRFMMLYNVLEKQENIDIMNAEGELITVDVAQLRDSDLEFKIADGLKGLDKLSMVEFMKDMLNALLQSSVANESIDVVQVIDHVSSIMGDETDFSQFKFKTEFDKLPKEQKELAFQLLQQAAAQQGDGAAPAPVDPNAPVQQQQ